MSSQLFQKLAIFYVLIILVFTFSAGQAKAVELTRLDTLVTFQYILEENDDLGTASRDQQNSKSAQARILANVQLTNTVDSYVDVRGILITGDSGSEDDTGAVSSQNTDFIELRRAWLRVKELFGEVPLSLKLGRQRIKEKRTIWWNRDFDAALVNYDTTLFKGFVGIGQNLASYRTSNTNFMEDDQDRLRVFGETSWQWLYNHFFETRVLYENDYSGTESVGTLVKTNDRDLEDAQLLWVGVRAAGETKPQFLLAKVLRYSVDAIGVAGEEKLLTTGPGPTSAYRIVNAVAERDVLGWALDAVVDLEVDNALEAVLSFGYAFGSGDDDMSDGTDNSFRQSGLHGNSSYRGLSTGSVRNYGEVLRPELSNMHIVTAGVGVPVGKAANVSFFYHYYRLDETAIALRSAAISAPLNGSDKSLGQAADIVFNLNVSKFLGLETPGFDRTKLKVTLGSFFAGQAYGPASDAESFRAFTELQMRF